MKVAELARAAGVTTWAVRWYESTGVLPPSRRTANGYRAYGSQDVAMLRLVVTLRRLGVRPADAGRAAVALLAGTEIDAGLDTLLADQLVTIARQRADLDRLEAEIEDLRTTIQATHPASGLTEDHVMPTTSPIRVLFVCTGNSARSQIAEALLRSSGGDDFQVASAGTEPKGVNPYTVRVLSEAGIDWSRARSRSVTEVSAQHWDYVITVCDRARQTCPVFPGQHDSLHWGLDDPAEVDGTDEEKLGAFRRTEVELSLRIRPFIEVALRAADRRRIPAVAEHRVPTPSTACPPRAPRAHPEHRVPT